MINRTMIAISYTQSMKVSIYIRQGVTASEHNQRIFFVTFTLSVSSYQKIVSRRDAFVGAT